MLKRGHFNLGVLVVFSAIIFTFAFLGSNGITGFSVLPTAVVSSCNATITSDSSLAADLVCTNQSAIIFGADNIVFDCQGFDILSSSGLSFASAFVADGVTNITIKNCDVANFTQAVSMINTNDSSVLDSSFNCVVHKCSYGAYLSNAYNNYFDNADFFSGQNNSLFLTSSDNNEFYDSVFRDYGYAGAVDSIPVNLNYSDNNYFYNITADDRSAYGSNWWDSIGLYIYKSDNNTFNVTDVINFGSDGAYGLISSHSSGNNFVSSNVYAEYWGVYLENCTDFTFSGLAVNSSFSEAIYAYDINGTLFENFTVYSYDAGFYFEPWNYPFLFNNTIRNGTIDAWNSAQGIYWENVINSTIEDVDFVNLEYSGIYFSSSSNNTVSRVDIDSANSGAFYLSYSDSNVVSDSNFTGRDDVGIDLYYADLNVFDNVIAYSEDDDGVMLMRSTNNSFNKLTAAAAPGFIHIGLANFSNSTSNLSIGTNSLYPTMSGFNSIDVDYYSSGNLFNNTKILPGDNWITVYSNAVNTRFYNTTFANRFGFIQIPGNFSLGGSNYYMSNQVQINKSLAYLDIPNLPAGFNGSSSIKLNYVDTFNNVMIDVNDSGNYQNCVICANVSFDAAADTVSFDVPHWTTYAINGTSIDMCGLTLTSDFIMTENFTIFGDETCFTFGADSITLDCNGYHIFGSDGTQMGSGGIGIYASGKSNIEVKNCHINGTNYGISFENINDSKILNTEVRGHNIYSLRLSNSHRNTINNSYFRAMRSLWLAWGPPNSDNVFEDTTFRAYDDVFYIESSANNTYSNLTLFVEPSDGGGGLENLDDSLRDSSLDISLIPLSGDYANWIDARSNSFNATFSDSVTFSTSFSMIEYPVSNPITTLPQLYVPTYTHNTPIAIVSGNDSAFVNSTAYPELNYSANITFFNVSDPASQGLWDPEDDGAFLPCPASVCTDFSRNGSEITLEVQHWTTYSVGRQPYIDFYSTPSSNASVANSSSFTYTAYIDCLGGDCGNITVVLDPIGVSAWTPTNEWNSTDLGIISFGSPKAAEVNGDYLIFVSASNTSDDEGKIFAFNASGGVVWTYSHPNNTPGQDHRFATPAIDDLDNDGDLEVVVMDGYGGGMLAVLDAATGTELDKIYYPAWLATLVQRPNPAISDLDYDNVSDIVFLSQTSRSTFAGSCTAFAYYFNGTDLVSKWTTAYLDCYNTVQNGVAIGQYQTGASSKQVWFGTGSSSSREWNAIWNLRGSDGDEGFGPVTQEYYSGSDLNQIMISMGDVDGDGDTEVIYILQRDPKIVISHYPTPTVEIPLSYDVNGPISLADIDGNGDLELFFIEGSASNEYLRAYHHDGTIMWSYQMPYVTSAYNQFSERKGLTIADLDGDGDYEVSFLSVLNNGGTYHYNLTILNADNGAVLFDEVISPSAPECTGSNLAHNAPLAADIDQDGSKELIISNPCGNLQTWSFTGTGTLSTSSLLGGLEWPSFHGNSRSSGLYADQSTVLQATTNIIPTTVSLADNIQCTSTITAEGTTYSDVQFVITSPLSGSYSSNGTLVGSTWYSDYVTVDKFGSWSCVVSANNSLTGSRADLGATTLDISGSKGGAVPVGSGSPFYTTDPNPQTCYNLMENQTCALSWNVVANGTPASIWQFYAEITNVLLPSSIQELIAGQRTDDIFMTIDEGPGPSPAPRRSSGGGGGNAAVDTIIIKTDDKKTQTPSETFTQQYVVREVPSVTQSIPKEQVPQQAQPVERVVFEQPSLDSVEKDSNLVWVLSVIGLLIGIGVVAYFIKKKN